MTEHGASIFVFFFLGEYSSLILMSSFMSIFFLGGHHCPDLHKLILDPLVFIYYYIESRIISYEIDGFYDSYITALLDSGNFHLINNIGNSDLVKYLGNSDLSGYFTKFSGKDTILQSISILVDKIQGSYTLGFK